MNQTQDTNTANPYELHFDRVAYYEHQARVMRNEYLASLAIQAGKNIVRFAQSLFSAPTRTRNA